VTNHQSPVTGHGRIVNALTVDVEDYFHVAAFASSIQKKDWESYKPRVEKNTHRLLDIFSEHGSKATFFILGWVAERHPHLVKEIVERGHEIACHGYSHELVYQQTPDEFRSETVRALKVLEDTSQVPIRGYRAASFSITQKSLWALDILAETGFTYDSSMFPIHHDRYGTPDALDTPHRLKTPSGYDLVEFPLSTVKVFSQRLPVSGGGYFRLYPYAFTRAALRSINKRRRQPFIFYLHPWEIDPGQPPIRATWLSRFRHYHNLDKCERRLGQLLTDFEFLTVVEVLAELELLGREPLRVVQE
jgi:polysaccharide deacetylase family protein (PEP-CTERM system associated)